MRTANLVVIPIAGTSSMVAVAAFGQVNAARSNNGQKAEAVEDAAGNLHVPDAYRTTCPSALPDVAAAVTRLGPDADKLQPLFITLDPRRDTPAVIGNYTQSFDPRIVGLTGTPQQIAAVA